MLWNILGSGLQAKKTPTKPPVEKHWTRKGSDYANVVQRKQPLVEKNVFCVFIFIVAQSHASFLPLFFFNSSFVASSVSRGSSAFRSSDVLRDNGVHIVFCVFSPCGSSHISIIFDPPIFFIVEIKPCWTYWTNSGSSRISWVWQKAEPPPAGSQRTLRWGSRPEWRSWGRCLWEKRRKKGETGLLLFFFKFMWSKGLLHSLHQ